MKRFLPSGLRRRLAVFHPRLIVNQAAHLDRTFIASKFIRGDGIEIGALANPLRVPRSVRVKYLDRMSVPDLRKQYPELATLELVDVDIIGDGETLAQVADESQDFVIANHFIEHCQNPLATLSNMFRVLRHNGILYLAIPDKRYTFDSDREVTPIEHLWQDYEAGPAGSRRQHFSEWVRLVNKVEDPKQVEDRIENLMGMDYSIHYHVWTQREMLEIVSILPNKLNLSFDVVLFIALGEECIFVLRKSAAQR